MSLVGFAGAEITLAQFASGELEQISGFPQHLQRLWRSRGHLSEKTPHKRSQFSTTEVAELFVRYLLAVYCVSPLKSRSVAERAAPMIIWAALLNTDGACEIIGSQDEVESFSNAFASSDAVATALAGLTGDYSRYLWSADGSDFEFAKESAQVFASHRGHTYVFLDLEALATSLGERARKPLISIRLPGSGDQRIARKLTSGTRAEVR